MRHKQSEEHKVAGMIAKAISSLTLDLEQVGIYLAREYPNVIFRRFQIIYEATEHEKEEVIERNYIQY